MKARTQDTHEESRPVTPNKPIKMLARRDGKVVEVTPDDYVPGEPLSARFWSDRCGYISVPDYPIEITVDEWRAQWNAQRED